MYLQLNTQFNPFTFEEMIKPLLLYKQAYDTTEAQYAELQAQTEQWKQAAENDSSPLVRSMYNDYAQRLNNILTDFSKGMTASNRAASMRLKKDFAQNIKPIEVAFKRREALEDEQRKAGLANDSLIFERNAGDMSLEDFIKNPSASYGDVINGNVLRAASAQAYKNLARRIREGDSQLKKILPYTYDRTQRFGLTEEEILQALKDDPNANEAARMIRDTIRSTTNIDQWNNEMASNKVDAFINEGMWNALGTEQSNIINDSYGMQSALSAQSYRQQAALEEQKFKHSVDLFNLQYPNGKGNGRNGNSKLGNYGTIPWDRLDSDAEVLNTEVAKYVQMASNLFNDAGFIARYNGNGLSSDEKAVVNFMKKNGFSMPSYLGKNEIQNIQKQISNTDTSNLRISARYRLRVTNTDSLTKLYRSNLLASGASDNDYVTGLTTQDGKKIKVKDFDKYLGNIESTWIDGKDMGMYVASTGVDEKGNSVRYYSKISPIAYGNASGSIRRHLKLAEECKKNGMLIDANRHLGEATRLAVNQANTQVQTQTQTTSNAEVPDPYFIYHYLDNNTSNLPTDPNIPTI